MTQQPRRKRGVILTPQGKQKLLGAIREFERDHNFGEKYTIEELSGRTGNWLWTLSRHPMGDFSGKPVIVMGQPISEASILALTVTMPE